MLYAFIEKILVHAPIGGRSAKRRQQIDVYFSFIGTFVPPGVEEEEEAKRAEQERQRAERRRVTQQRSAQRRKSGWPHCGKRPRQTRQLPPSTKPTGCSAAPMERTIGSAAGRGKEQRHGRAAIRTVWRMHLQYLKQDRPVLYIALVTSGSLWPYLEELNCQAQGRMERLTSQWLPGRASRKR